MQRRGPYGGGELEVFRGTRYFAGLAALREPAGGLLIQVKVTLDMKPMEESIQDLVLGAKSTKNLATFLGSLLCPLASFPRNPLAASSRTNQPATSSSTTSTTAGSHDEPPQGQVVSSLSSSRVRGLSEVVGDRRLQGVRVVRGAGVGEETWVVRCGGGHALEEVHHASADHQVVDGDDCGSDGDTSSDLFELDLEDVKNH